MLIADPAKDFEITSELFDPTAENLSAYSRGIAAGWIVVGHSVEYHHGHLRAAMVPIGLDPRDGLTKTICTMMALTGHAIKANGRKGWPTFSEACSWAGVERAGTETADDNARCLLRVFRSMAKAGLVPEPKIWKDRSHG